MTGTIKNLWVLAIIPLLMFSLSACGSSTPSTTTAAGSSSPTTSSPTTAATTAASGSTQQATTPATESTSSTTGATAAGTTPAGAVSTTKLNLNTVTEDELLNTIPNFSTRMVREFMEYRPYVSIQQFRQEIGKYVDAEQVATYEQYVYVPVDVDESDAATLQQLPGVDATIAADLIGARPYGSNEAFLAKLAEHVSDSDLTSAAAYLAAN